MGTRTKIIGIAAVVAASAALFAAPAQARTSINLSIGAPIGYGYAQPNYVYTQPGYVYAQPSYGYAQPGYVYTEPSYVYSQPSYVYVQPSYRGYRHGVRRDSDHDGVPNRFDRRPHNPRRY